MGIFKSRNHPRPWPESKMGTEDPRPADGRIDSAIDRAIREGQFDNLPGKGEPLDADYLKSGSEFVMQKILKEQGFVPEWARLLQAVERVDEALTSLRDAGSDAETKQLRGELTRVRNDLVRALNRRVPTPALQRGFRDPGRDA